MHIALITVGSRGDAQPCVALGIGLRDAGHEVTLVTHEIYRDFVTEYGIAFAPIEGNPRALMEGDDGQSWLQTGSNPLAMMAQMRKLMMPLTHQLMVDALDACQDADLVLFAPLAFTVAISIAEKFELQCAGMYLQPVNPSRTYSSSMFPPLPEWMPLRTVYNRLSHVLLMELYWRMFKDALNAARAEVLDLPPIAVPFRKSMHDPNPVIYGYSSHFVPRPPDWGAHIDVTGYWFLDEPDWQPPDELLDFLNSGEPPVYIGFGSMANRKAEEAAESTLNALAQSGQRGILLSGWGGITAADLPDTVFKIDAAPHSWLFPRMAAVVHHGGAGTTAAGLRAGVPTVVIPHFADQPFWGHQIHRCGVGPKPIPRKKLSADNLAHAIKTAVPDASMQQEAKMLSEQLGSEDGVGNAVNAIERMFG